MLLSSWPFAILITDYVMAALSSSSEVLLKICEDLSSPKRVTVSVLFRKGLLLQNKLEKKTKQPNRSNYNS